MKLIFPFLCKYLELTFVCKQHDFYHYHAGAQLPHKLWSEDPAWTTHHIRQMMSNRKELMEFIFRGVNL